MRKLLKTLTEIGFRRSTDEQAEAVHRIVTIAVRNWFEFLKRIGIVAVLGAAGRNSRIAEVLYYASLLALGFPVFTWLERWQIDRRADVSAGQRGWAYSSELVIVTVLVATAANVFVQGLIFEMSSIMRNH